MNKIREYVEALDDAVKIEIRDNRDQFERDGAIGDCALRLNARKLMAQLGVVGDAHITLWMDRVACECDRYFADQYFIILNGAKPLSPKAG